MTLQLIGWDRWREAIAALPHNEKMFRKIVVLEGRGGELYPHIEAKYFDALVPSTRPDETGKRRDMDVLVLSDLRQSSQRQMGLELEFTPMAETGSPGLREAKGRRRSNGNNRRRKKEGKQKR